MSSMRVNAITIHFGRPTCITITFIYNSSWKMNITNYTVYYHHISAKASQKSKRSELIDFAIKPRLLGPKRKVSSPLIVWNMWYLRSNICCKQQCRCSVKLKSKLFVILHCDRHGKEYLFILFITITIF